MLLKGRALEVGDPAALACENWGSEHKARELNEIEKQLKQAVLGDGIMKILQNVCARIWLSIHMREITCVSFCSGQCYATGTSLC